MPKALVAMSGGVDSVAAAILMMQKGFEVCGVNMLLCPNSVNSNDAKRACEQLGIDFFSLDCRDLFKARVIDPFIDSYCSGKTPNPCICCNKHLKFGYLWEEAQKGGFDVLATGHYARVSWDCVPSEPILQKAEDVKKDQSYVLYSVKPEYFKKIYFPLGEITKEQARNIVKNAGVDIYKKSESQDICFVENGDYAAFIAENRNDIVAPGDFVDTYGNVLGKHRGMINYTVGQRRGLGISAVESYYVVDKNIDSNTVVLGFEKELLTKRFRVNELNVLSPSLFADGIKCSVRTRYHQEEHDCIVTFDGDCVNVETVNAIRKPASGQSAVFYLGDRVIAGGIIL